MKLREASLKKRLRQRGNRRGGKEDKRPSKAAGELPFGDACALVRTPAGVSEEAAAGRTFAVVVECLLPPASLREGLRVQRGCRQDVTMALKDQSANLANSTEAESHMTPLLYQLIFTFPPSGFQKCT